jgi:hypothetical protein
MQVRALVLAGDVLFVAGTGPSPGKPPEGKNVSSSPLILALSTTDGTELARYPIDAPPIFDGMAAAGGELLVALENGTVMCMTGE